MSSTGRCQVLITHDWRCGRNWESSRITCATHRIVPDVTIVRNPHPVHETAVGGAAVLTAPRSDVSRFIEYEVLSEPIRHHFVEIRDSSQGHKLITLIEIVSPSNKRPGPDRQAYERKQRKVLESDASLVEIDLLRDGRRILPEPGSSADRRLTRAAGIPCPG